MTIGAPTRSALEVEDAMLAFGMNGEPLPVEHGFPVRMLIPGLYGYVSACKWLTGIEATTFDAFDAYWVERDWAAEGPIKVASRIDTPAPLRAVPRRPPRHRRRRLGADPGHRPRRGAGRRGGLGAGPALPGGRRRPVAPVGAALRLRRRAGTRSPSAPPAPTARCRPRRGPPRSPPAPPAGTPSRWSPDDHPLRPPAGPRPSRHPPATRLRTAPAAGAPPRPRQCGRTDRTRSTIP